MLIGMTKKAYLTKMSWVRILTSFYDIENLT